MNYKIIFKHKMNQNNLKKTLVQTYYDFEKDLKQKFGENSILFLQKGKFYELYSISSNFPIICDLINIFCTRVNNKIKEDISSNNPYMAGFPIDSVDRYIRVLLNNNYTIGIVDETGNNITNTCKKRELTRILSPSTYIENDNNYLLCKPLVAVYITEENIISITNVTLSTGIITIYPETKYKESKLLSILSQNNPSEIIFYFDTQIQLNNFQQIISNNIIFQKTLVHIKIINKELKKINYQNEFLDKIFKLKTLGITTIECLHLEKFNITISCLIVLLQFAIDHDSLIVSNLKKPILLSNSNIVTLSDNTITQLHILEIIKHIDHTSTKMGSRLLKERIMYLISSQKKLTERYNEINTYLNLENKEHVIMELKKICDIDQLYRKLSIIRIQFNELIKFYNSIKISKKILEFIFDKNLELSKININTLKNLNKFILNFEKTINFNSQNVIFNNNIYTDLDILVNEQKELFNKVNIISDSISKLDNGDKLKLGTCNDEFYFIVNKSRSSILKSKNNNLILKNTKTEYRISTIELDNLAIRNIDLSKDIELLNTKLYKEYCKYISNTFALTIHNTSKLISEIDLNLSLSILINQYNFNIPSINKIDNDLNIKDMIHPLIELNHPSGCVPNDVNLNDNLNGMLLLSINFSGKSSYLRSTAICLILAQSGFPIPAKSMKFKPFKTIITKIATGDDLLSCQSLFTNEVKEIKNMIELAGKDTIIFADELCNGTEIISALSLVSSTIINITKKKCKFIFSSHMNQLLNIKEIKELTNVKPFHFSVRIENKLIFDRKLVEGNCESNYGIEVAQYMKLPNDFIYQANQIRNVLNNNTSIISTKTSRYNNNIYMTECKICKNKTDLHTHHILFQSNFSKDNKTKNYKNNLVVLCEDCHTSLHQGKIEINGYIDTNEGEILV
jgi:DNA mismatch repair protein MutS